MNTRFIIKSSLEAELQAFMESQETLIFPVFEDPEVSIIIVDFNQPGLTLNCLKSVLKTVQIPYEIILIENAPEPNTLNFINRLSNVVVYINSENFHFLKGSNQGAQIARSPYLLFLNNDTVLFPNAVSIAKNTIEKSNKTGIVGAKIILFNGQLQEVGCYLFEDGRTKGVGRYENPFQEKYSYTRPVDYTSGAFLFIRKALFEEVGQFDEEYAPAYFEDVDLCLKVQDLGYEVIVNPDIIIQHLENGTSDIKEGSTPTYIESNRLKLIQKHNSFLINQYPFSNALNSDRAKKPSFVAKELIVVMGMHRSGTSAITKSLDSIGVHFGDHLLPPVPGVNDKGFWENYDIFQFNEKLLYHINHKWDSIELIDEEKIKFLKSEGFVDEAIQLLHSKVKEGSVFTFKDPRLCQLLLFWKQVFAVGNFKVKYILCLRHPSAVAASLIKRDGMIKSKVLLLWLTYNLNALHYLKNTEYTIVNYDELMTHPENELDSLFSFLAYPIVRNKYNQYLNDFLDQDLYHFKYNSSDQQDLESLDGMVQIIYSNLLANRKKSLEENDLIKNYFSAIQTLNPVFKIMDENPNNYPLVKEAQRISEEYRYMKKSITDINKLILGKDKKIAQLELEIQNLRNSWSWKISLPFRIIFKNWNKN